MRALLLPLLLLLLHGHSGAQTSLTNTQALAMVARLEADPMHKDARSEMDVFFNWLDKTDSAVVMIADQDMNAIFDRKVPYNRNLYILLLGGMARFDLQHPETDIEDPVLDREAGFACMCAGYRNVVAIHGFKQDRFFKRMCKDVPVLATPSAVEESPQVGK